MRRAVSGAFIRKEKILLVRKRNTWILPGGKPEQEDKNDMATLIREVKEELPNLEIKQESLFYFDVFQGITPHEEDTLLAKVFVGEASGGIETANEINDSGWFEKPKEKNLSDITGKIVRALEYDEYL